MATPKKKLTLAQIVSTAEKRRRDHEYAKKKCIPKLKKVVVNGTNGNGNLNMSKTSDRKDVSRAPVKRCSGGPDPIP